MGPPARRRSSVRFSPSVEKEITSAVKEAEEDNEVGGGDEVEMFEEEGEEVEEQEKPLKPTRTEISRRIRRSVHLLGYDIADQIWAEEQRRFCHEEHVRGSEEGVDSERQVSLLRLLAKEERETALRRALVSKIVSLEGVFEHCFSTKVLGFALALARYGDKGRFFLEVDATRPSCDLYPHILKPHDELVAVNDYLIVSADPGRFDQILQLIGTSPRPIKLTFLEGEGRDLAFAEQERARRRNQQLRGLLNSDYFEEQAAVEEPKVEAISTASLSQHARQPAWEDVDELDKPPIAPAVVDKRRSRHASTVITRNLGMGRARRSASPRRSAKKQDNSKISAAAQTSTAPRADAETTTLYYHDDDQPDDDADVSARPIWAIPWCGMFCNGGDDIYEDTFLAEDDETEPHFLQGGDRIQDADCSCFDFYVPDDDYASHLVDDDEALFGAVYRDKTLYADV